MHNSIKYILAFFTLYYSYSIAKAQVAINITGNDPDSTAMLDISSTDKGILIPRMDSTSRTTILNPADGLMVYDSSTTTFWYYDQNQWNEIRNGSEALTIKDVLGNTPEPDFSCLEIIGSLTSDNDLLSVAASGNYVYILEGVFDENDDEIVSNVVKIVDATDPDNPNAIGNLNIVNDPSAMTASGSYIYTIRTITIEDDDDENSFNDNQLEIIDVSDPTVPNSISTLNIGIFFRDPLVFVSGNYVYVQINVGRFRIIDISDPNNPNTIGNLNIGGTPVSIATMNNYLYVLDNNSDDLRIIDISDSNNPVTISSKTIGNDPKSIDVEGNYAYVVFNGSNDLKIFNLNDPIHPVLINTNLGIGNEPLGISVTANYAYIIDGISDDLTVVQLLCSPASLVRFDKLSGAFTLLENNFVITENGNVGIGTNFPTRAKVEIIGSLENDLGGSYGVLRNSPFVSSGSGSSNYSLYADSRIAAPQFHAFSDARIKNILGISDAAADLKTLMAIQITDYKHLDSLQKGNAQHKKVIAQQVAAVFPQAVTNNITEVIPDIYQRATMKDSWIELATDLEAGDRVKIITEGSSNIHKVTAVEKNRFQVETLHCNVSTTNCMVFVYGREVQDFHAVDYEALSMLNISATQAQQARIEALEQQNKQLAQRLAQLELLLQSTVATAEE